MDQGRSEKHAMRAIEAVRARSTGGAMPARMSVTLNFHPDWVFGGKSVIESIADERLYRSQFETRTSNGGQTAHPGGDRWLWEQKIFAGAYDDAPPALRPKYGALNETGSPFGGAPRFGSAHFRLKPDWLDRTTFCFPDSCYDPREFGVADRMALLDRKGAHLDALEPLDRYVEAHVHGVVEVGAAFDALVLDPIFRGTEVEDHARKLGCAIEWHPGYRLHPDRAKDIAQYRGADVAAILPLVSAADVLTPRDIGRAQRSGSVDPVLLKRLWHSMARFGQQADYRVGTGTSPR